VRGSLRLKVLKGVIVHRKVCAELLRLSRRKECNDRIATGLSSVYSPWVGRSAQSGGYSGQLVVDRMMRKVGDSYVPGM